MALEDIYLPDVEFWTCPLVEREAAFATLREHPIQFFDEPIVSELVPRGRGYHALTRHAEVVEATAKGILDDVIERGMLTPAELASFFLLLVVAGNETTRNAIAHGLVALWYASANRDAAVFDDPYRFDVGRTPNDHLSFGGPAPTSLAGR